MTSLLETNAGDSGQKPEGGARHPGHHNERNGASAPIGRFAIGEAVFEWEGLIITEAQMRGLARVGHDHVIVFDREAEIDVIVEEDGEIVLVEGEIFRLRAKPRPIVQIKVNNKPVKIHRGRRTGLEIKTAAIDQGVEIKLDFTLSLEGHGEPDRVIGDKDHVLIKGCEEFIAVDHHEDS